MEKIMARYSKLPQLLLRWLELLAKADIVKDLAPHSIDFVNNEIKRQVRVCHGHGGHWCQLPTVLRRRSTTEDPA